MRTVAAAPSTLPPHLPPVPIVPIQRLADELVLRLRHVSAVDDRQLLVLVRGAEEIQHRLDVGLDGQAEVETIEETFEELIEQFTEALEIDEFEDELDLDPEEKAKRERKKGKARVVEYDPDLDEMVVRRRRKREEGDEWGGDF